MEEMVFMAVINFKVLPASSAAASAAAAAANSIYNCHMMSSSSRNWGFLELDCLQVGSTYTSSNDDDYDT